MDREERIRLLTSSGRVNHNQAELIVRVIAGGADGDRAARDLFDDSFFRRLRAQAIYRLRNDDDADDCVGKTMLEVSRSLSGFKGQSALYSWVHTIAARAAVRIIEERMVIREHEVVIVSATKDGDPGDVFEPGDIEPDPDLSVDPEANARWTQYRTLLKDCQERISRDPDTGQPDPFRQCVTEQWKRAFEMGAKTTAQDVADACGSVTGAFGKIIDKAYRVRKELQHCLESRGVTRESLSGFTREKRKGPGAGERS